MEPVAGWEARGSYHSVLGRRIFVVDEPAARPDAEPVLVLHGFPTCSFDWRHVLPGLAERRRVVLLDMLGYGLSEKPHDHRYSLFEQADIVEATAKELGLEEVALVTHDMGDSVGGELLARALDGALGFRVTGRAITNGSIYMELVQLSAGQLFLLAMPDAPLGEDQAPNEALFRASLAATFAAQPSAEELGAQWRLLAREGGNRILPRLIRYVEERRVHEERWTGAIERHPSPLGIVWGDADPIAVYPMAERLAERRPDAGLVRLEGIGHYLMIEAPDRLSAALREALS